MMINIYHLKLYCLMFLIRRVARECNKNVVKITQNTLFLAKNTPPPQQKPRPHWDIQIVMDGLCVKVYQEFKELEILMEDLGTSFLNLPSIPPLPPSPPPNRRPGLELIMEDLGIRLILSRIPPQPGLELLLTEDFAGDWCVETDRCIPCGYRLGAELMYRRTKVKMGKFV